MLEREYEYFLEQLPNLLEKHKGKFVAIRDHQVIGVYDTRPEAVEKTSAQHQLGTFIVQQVIEAEDQVQRFYSRVTF